MTITPASVTRLALIGVFGGIMQLSAVSQITIFGMNRIARCTSMTKRPLRREGFAPSFC